MADGELERLAQEVLKLSRPDPGKYGDPLLWERNVKGVLARIFRLGQGVGWDKHVAVAAQRVQDELPRGSDAKPISAYQYGWVRGTNDARHVLDVESRSYSEEMRFFPEGMPDGALLPMTVKERADWLNGYAAGIRHITLDTAIKERDKRS